MDDAEFQELNRGNDGSLHAGPKQKVSGFMLEQLNKARAFLRDYYKADVPILPSESLLQYRKRVAHANASLAMFDFDDAEVEEYVALLLAKFVSLRYEEEHRDLITLYLSDMLQQDEEGDLAGELFSPKSSFADSVTRFLRRQVSGDCITFYHGFFGKPRLWEIALRAALNDKTFNAGKKPMTSEDFVHNAQQFYAEAAGIGRHIPAFQDTASVLERLADNLPKCVEVMRTARCEFLY